MKTIFSRKTRGEVRPLRRTARLFLFPALAALCLGNASADAARPEKKEGPPSPREARAKTAEQAPGPGVDIVFSAGQDPAAVLPSFPCSERVYAHLSFPDSFQGQHRIEGLWFRPDGELQERTKITLDFPAQGRKTAYLWLNFGKENKTLLDDFVLGGDYGQRGNPFHGTWTLQILADGRAAGQASFKVACGK